MRHLTIEITEHNIRRVRGEKYDGRQMDRKIKNSKTSSTKHRENRKKTQKKSRKRETVIEKLKEEKGEW